MQCAQLSVHNLVSLLPLQIHTWTLGGYSLPTSKASNVNQWNNDQFRMLAE